MSDAGVREACAQVVDGYIRSYPTSLFPEPEPGEHGGTVASCAAAALRAILPNVAADIRKLELEEGYEDSHIYLDRILGLLDRESEAQRKIANGGAGEVARMRGLVRSSAYAMAARFLRKELCRG